MFTDGPVTPIHLETLVDLLRDAGTKKLDPQTVSLLLQPEGLPALNPKREQTRQAIAAAEDLGLAERQEGMLALTIERKDKRSTREIVLEAIDARVLSSREAEPYFALFYSYLLRLGKMADDGKEIRERWASDFNSQAFGGQKQTNPFNADKLSGLHRWFRYAGLGWYDPAGVFQCNPYERLQRALSNIFDGKRKLQGSAFLEMTGLSGGNLRDIFDRIRADLQATSQTLALFIEDVTAMSEFDTEVVNAVEPQDRLDLCPLIAILGLTNTGKNRLRANQLQRASLIVGVGDDEDQTNRPAQLWREDGEGLAQFAARTLEPFLEPLGFQPFSTKVGGATGSTGTKDRREEKKAKSEREEEEQEKVRKREKGEQEKVKKVLDNLRSWLADKEKHLARNADLRQLLADFVRTSVRWDDERSPPTTEWKRLLRGADDKRKYEVIYIDGQGADPATASFVIREDFPRTEETRALLEALVRFAYEGDGSWNFTGGELHKRVVARWLRKHEEGLLKRLDPHGGLDTRLPVAAAVEFLCIAAVVRRGTKLPTDPEKLLAAVLADPWPEGEAPVALSRGWRELLEDMHKRHKEVRDFVLAELAVNQGAQAARTSSTRMPSLKRRGRLPRKPRSRRFRRSISRATGKPATSRSARSQPTQTCPTSSRPSEERWRPSSPRRARRWRPSATTPRPPRRQ